MSLAILLSCTLTTLTLLLPYVCAQKNVISPGKTLVAGNDDVPWLSRSEEFALGFHQLENNDNLFLLAIWYHKIPEKTIIWYANGDNPAPKGSKLRLDKNSGLVLTSSPQDDNAELWRSDSISGTISRGLVNDTGNFQLLGENSQVLWDTFSRPTDTLVPTQIMEMKGTLNSRLKETNFSRGRFQFRMLEDGQAVLNPISLPTNLTYEAYYISGTHDDGNKSNSGLRVVFDDSGFLYIMREGGDRFDITSPDDVLSTDSYYYRATINFDGVFTISYHPKNSTATDQRWTVVKTLPENICMNLTGAIGGSGVCGFNSICTLNTDKRPMCKCPEGYSLLDSTDPYGSCIPNLELAGCDQASRHSSSQEEDLQYFMRQLPDTNWPYADYEVYKPYKLEDCKNSCLQDCMCAVSIFKHEDSTCWKKKLPLPNGRKDREGGLLAFLKLRKNNGSSSATPPIIQVKTSKKDQHTLITVISVLLGGSAFINFMLVSAVCVGFFYYYKKIPLSGQQ